MRVYFVLITSACCLLASSSAVSAEVPFVNSASAVQATATRQLRGVAVDSDEGSLGSASVDEERGGVVDEIPEKAVSTFARLGGKAVTSWPLSASG
ncbi:hypothetical protein PHYSODRAFT_467694 [Phytophthora sojae]|uniref:RxLR effector protein n=3 Tax=Phytophthora sojae TaxID=67593 RepID=G4YF89_PHYSP|nr:hypothetical protein PHYSODRAFT_467694 [Phytophthora sojae]AEK80957.1 Avh220a1 [Phytophthora sojae]AEK80958.1 Avh220a1 [Phytophthora sojae]EGZ27993.1 hypothetical protein PHYSODRAFT_467694 [Phytophthora sojae]|eukprot:XP_009515268.1 hypothetical protein PHYSODRAFT_467694 [Phytophthora sojae]